MSKFTLQGFDSYPTVEFELRDGMVFRNSEPMTLQDVAHHMTIRTPVGEWLVREGVTSLQVVRGLISPNKDLFRA